MFEFREEDHSYHLDGEIIPSVTQILNEWRKVKVGNSFWYVNTHTGAVIDAATFERAGDFGTAIHKACKLILFGDLDWDGLDPDLILPLRQFEKAVDDLKLKASWVEVPMWHKRKKIAGTPDIIGNINLTRQLSCIDIKTGDFALVGPQTACYCDIFKNYANYKGMMSRYVLYLPKDGGEYKIVPMKNSRDLSYFDAKLYQYRYLRAA